jgi:hypothetical protein
MGGSLPPAPPQAPVMQQPQVMAPQAQVPPLGQQVGGGLPPAMMPPQAQVQQPLVAKKPEKAQSEQAQQPVASSLPPPPVGAKPPVMSPQAPVMQQPQVQAQSQNEEQAPPPPPGQVPPQVQKKPVAGQQVGQPQMQAQSQNEEQAQPAQVSQVPVMAQSEQAQSEQLEYDEMHCEEVSVRYIDEGDAYKFDQYLKLANLYFVSIHYQACSKYGSNDGSLIDKADTVLRLINEYNFNDARDLAEEVGFILGTRDKAEKELEQLKKYYEEYKEHINNLGDIWFLCIKNNFNIVEALKYIRNAHKYFQGVLYVLNDNSDSILLHENWIGESKDIQNSFWEAIDALERFCEQNQGMLALSLGELTQHLNQARVECCDNINEVIDAIHKQHQVFQEQDKLHKAGITTLFHGCGEVLSCLEKLNNQDDEDDDTDYCHHMASSYVEFILCNYVDEEDKDLKDNVQKFLDLFFKSLPKSVVDDFKIYVNSWFTEHEEDLGDEMLTSSMKAVHKAFMNSVNPIDSDPEEELRNEEEFMKVLKPLGFDMELNNLPVMDEKKLVKQCHLHFYENFTGNMEGVREAMKLEVLEGYIDKEDEQEGQGESSAIHNVPRPEGKKIMAHSKDGKTFFVADINYNNKLAIFQVFEVQKDGESLMQHIGTGVYQLRVEQDPVLLNMNLLDTQKKMQTIMQRLWVQDEKDLYYTLCKDPETVTLKAVSLSRAEDPLGIVKFDDEEMQTIVKASVNEAYDTLWNVVVVDDDVKTFEECYDAPQNPGALHDFAVNLSQIMKNGSLSKDASDLGAVFGAVFGGLASKAQSGENLMQEIDQFLAAECKACVKERGVAEDDDSEDDDSEAGGLYARMAQEYNQVVESKLAGMRSKCCPLEGAESEMIEGDVGSYYSSVHSPAATKTATTTAAPKTATTTAAPKTATTKTPTDGEESTQDFSDTEFGTAGQSAGYDDSNVLTIGDQDFVKPDWMSAKSFQHCKDIWSKTPINQTDQKIYDIEMKLMKDIIDGKIENNLQVVKEEVYHCVKGLFISGSAQALIEEMIVTDLAGVVKDLGD